MAIPTKAVEAEIIHELPATLEWEIGRIAILYSRLENDLFTIVALILQLHKVEGRLAIRDQRACERVETIQDLLGLKGLYPEFDFNGLRQLLEKVGNDRDRVVHGVWLRHPQTGKVHLRMTRGTWKRLEAYQPKVSRKVWPEGPEFDVSDARAIRANIKLAMERVNALGQLFDGMLEASPDRFRPLGPLINPLGRHKPKVPQGPRGSSRVKE